MSVGRMAKLWRPVLTVWPQTLWAGLPRCHSGVYQKRGAPEPRHSHICSFICSSNNNALSSLALGTGRPEPLVSEWDDRGRSLTISEFKEVEELQRELTRSHVGIEQEEVCGSSLQTGAF